MPYRYKPFLSEYTYYMVALPLIILYILVMLVLLTLGALLSISTYAGGIYKKSPDKPWAVERPGMRTAYYASEEDARRDAQDNLVRGGRGGVRKMTGN
jgi:hypothetical protein